MITMSGLQGHSLLAFMAAVGAARTSKAIYGDGVKLGWSKSGTIWTPILDVPVSEDQWLTDVSTRLENAEAYHPSVMDKDALSERLNAAFDDLEQTTRLRAIATDFVVTNNFISDDEKEQEEKDAKKAKRKAPKEGKYVYTFAGYTQFNTVGFNPETTDPALVLSINKFIDRYRPLPAPPTAPTGTTPSKKPGKAKKVAQNPSLKARLQVELFQPWLYDETRAASLCWDPNETREKAYFGSDPGDDKETQNAMNAAYRLAIKALPMYTVLAGTKPRTYGISRIGSMKYITSWPMWTGMVGCDTIRSLIANPEICSLRLNRDKINTMGIGGVYRSIIRKSGKYYRINRPELVV